MRLIAPQDLAQLNQIHVNAREEILCKMLELVGAFATTRLHFLERVCCVHGFLVFVNDFPGPCLERGGLNSHLTVEESRPQ